MEVDQQVGLMWVIAPNETSEPHATPCTHGFPPPHCPTPALLLGCHTCPACSLEQLETTSHDCEQLMPQAMESLQARVAQLAADLASVEQDIVEAEAKHELYKLLEIRTRWVSAPCASCGCPA